jgi:flavin reductase (DIM6/NTAB) family NADH-FMN oxidoreductase RutF
MIEDTTAVKTDHWTNGDSSDPNALRRAFGAFASGVTVVAAQMSNGEIRAFTANSFTSVSLDPPLALVCLGKNAASLKLFEACDIFSISILQASQRNISSAFASRDPAVKIAASRDLVIDDAPYVADSLATFICSRHSVVDAGDHIILIGRIQKYRSNEGQPLGFFRGGYVHVGADLIEIERLHASVLVGGVLGYGGKVLLCRRPKSDSWEIPMTRPKRGQGPDGALQAVFESFGIEVTMSVPFSLFQERGEHDVTMIFSVQSHHKISPQTLADGTEIALFGIADEPWNQVKGEMKNGLIRRYLREMAAGLYSVYFDTPNGGSFVRYSGGPSAWQDSGEAPLNLPQSN